MDVDRLILWKYQIEEFFRINGPPIIRVRKYG